MRIIGGSARGRTLKAPRGAATRPTSDRVREAVMSMLDSRGALDGARVLDLYAGSGALSLEALSRGADRATCVDSAQACQRIIAENARLLGLADRCSVLPLDVERALPRLARQRERFDLIFADPPYAETSWELLANVPALLADGGLLLVEHGKRLSPPPQLATLELSLGRCYGDTAIALYERGDERVGE